MKGIKQFFFMIFKGIRGQYLILSGARHLHTSLPSVGMWTLSTSLDETLQPSYTGSEEYEDDEH